jgi:hypothetical protein
MQLAIARNRDADGGRDQPVRFARGGLGHDDKGDLARLEALGALGARQDAAVREDARHAHGCTPRCRPTAQRELNDVSLLAVLADTLRENISLGTNPTTSRSFCRWDEAW